MTTTTELQPLNLSGFRSPPAPADYISVDLPPSCEVLSHGAYVESLGGFEPCGVGQAVLVEFGAVWWLLMVTGR